VSSKPSKPSSKRKYDPQVAQWIEKYGEAAVIEAWSATKNESLYRGYEPYPKQLEFHLAPTKIVQFLAGNKAGKTWCAVMDLLMHATGEIPVSMEPYRDQIFRKPWQPGKFWVITRDYPTLREAVHEYFEKFLPNHWIESWNANEHILRLAQGSKISFRSADAGPLKLESAAVDGILVDEECIWAVFNALMARTLSTGGWIKFAMTAESGFTWTYHKFYRRREQEAVKKWLTVITATTYDNPYIDEEQIDLAESMWADDDIIRQVRLLGQYAEVTGAMVFSPHALARYRKQTCAPNRKHGILDIYQEPQADGIYIVGADVASGVPDGDFSAIVVLERNNWEVVACGKIRCQPDEFADHVALAADFYGHALVAVERQNHGLSTLITLRERGYHHLYCHTARDRVNHTTPSDALGWSTTASTKEEMIDNLRSLFGTRKGEGDLVLPSDEILDECGVFVYYSGDVPKYRGTHKTVGRCGAKSGHHDDYVIALAIAARVAKELYPAAQPRAITPAETPGTFANLKREIELEIADGEKGVGALRVVGSHLKAS